MDTEKPLNDKPTQADSSPDATEQQYAAARIYAYPPRCIRDSKYPVYTPEADGKEIVRGADYELLVDLIRAGMAYRHAVRYTVMLDCAGPYLNDGVYPRWIADKLGRSRLNTGRYLRQMATLGLFVKEKRHIVRFFRYEELLVRLAKIKQQRA